MNDYSKTEEFKKELKALMDKYGVSIDESENYDGEESYCGSTWTFYGPGVYLELSDL